MRRPLVALPLLLVACGGSAVAPPPEPQPGCNPIIGDDCLTPWPSSFYEVADATTGSGVHVKMAADALPQVTGGTQLSDDRLNQKDGFSPSTPFIVYFNAGVDPTNLPGPSADQLAMSVTAASAVQVLKYDDGSRVPVMAELDANTQPGNWQSLIVRPMTRLQPATRYIIALVGLKDASGAPLVPAPFKALRDKTALSQALKPLKATYDDLFAKLTAAGVDRSSLTLAWDVTTASDATATGHLTAMVKNALALADGGQLTYTLQPSVDTPTDPNGLYREILGTFQAPQYLVDNSGMSFLNFDGNNQPLQNGLVDTPFVIHIPQCAMTATAPVRTVVFGHGLFQNALAVLQTPLLEQVANQYCSIMIGTDWLGLDSDDATNLPNVLMNDVNKVFVVMDRLQQAHVNINTMVRMYLSQIIHDPQMTRSGGQPITDGSEIYYFGVSDGGIQGGTFMALNPDVERGVLNVPGCDWSLMMFRSVDFAPLKTLLQVDLHHALDQQVFVASLQSEWDYTDPATWAPHVLNDPIPGVPAKKLLLQMSVDDAQVTNLSTEMLARTMGVTGLDLEIPVFGVSSGMAPLDSAYTQWDSHPALVPPTTNVALSSGDNGAHDSVYQSPLAQQQIFGFLTPTGQIASVCPGGICDISKN